jgi:alpha-galactosidase
MRVSFLLIFLLTCAGVFAQDSLVNSHVRVVVNNNGKVSYYFANGVTLQNTTAAIEELTVGYVNTNSFSKHQTSVSGKQLTITHSGGLPFSLVQHITLSDAAVLMDVTAVGTALETRNITPLAASVTVPGDDLRILDVPFDNDNWVRVITPEWPKAKGISYEFSSVYNPRSMSGLVVGSLTHEFWKTGIVYNGDSLRVYGGAATEDNEALPPAHGGLDGTHDHAPHGTMKGDIVSSPLIYLSAGDDIRKTFVDYGEANVQVAGRLTWKGYAPVYWNSFGVEGVLGYSKVMMPTGVIKIADFIASLHNFNKYAKPVLSIDSYDQGIYTTELLASLGRYGKKKNQQMGFYFIPFAMWTWKNSIDQQTLGGTTTVLRDVILKDKDHQPIMYKKGDWAAYPIDPTHPATRAYIIQQLQKAKAINATFIKIDFLTAGSLESSSRYDRSVRSGMQAYNFGMAMLKRLVDSIMGPDIFITQAISPMFPHQYAHTRFLSTDVYSHLRDDQEGFPHWGSTEASLSAGSHLWWMQGTLFPYTNLDVAVMQRFQQNHELTEQEVKVRIYAMMTMGSILGDGSDFREKLAMERAKKYLDNADVSKFFSQPQVFTPLRMSDGETMDQQMSFYLKGDTTMVALFNFTKDKPFTETVYLKDIGLKGKYVMKEFFSGESLGVTDAESFKLTVPVKDAVMIKLIPAF